MITALLSLAAAAEVPAATEGPDLSGLSGTVQGERSTIDDAQSIAVVHRDDLQRNEGLFLDDVVNLIPGVRFESRTPSGGQRIVIRGYGQGTNFNGVGY